MPTEVLVVRFYAIADSNDMLRRRGRGSRSRRRRFCRSRSGGGRSSRGRRCSGRCGLGRCWRRSGRCGGGRRSCRRRRSRRTCLVTREVDDSADHDDDGDNGPNDGRSLHRVFSYRSMNSETHRRTNVRQRRIQQTTIAAYGSSQANRAPAAIARGAQASRVFSA